MPRKSTAKTQDAGLPETPKKRVRKAAKTTTRKIVARRKKTARDEEAPVVKITREIPHQDVPTVSQIRDDSIKTKERSVEIRVVDQVPISPYVIEFRSETDEPVAAAPPNVTPIIWTQPTVTRHPEPTFTPDFLALEEFFVGTDLQKNKEVREGGWANIRRVAEGRAQRVPEVARSDRGVSEASPRGATQQRPGDSETSRPPAPLTAPKVRPANPEVTPKTRRAPVLRPMVARSFAALRMTTVRLRATATFAVIALIFTLPATGLQAYTKLEQTKNALLLKNQHALAGFNVALDNPEAWKAALGRANTTFINTKNDLDRAVGIFGVVLPLIPKAGSAFRSSTILLDAGAHLTQAGRTIADGFTIIADSDLPLGERLLHFEESLRAAFPLIQAAEVELSRTKPNSLPTRVRGPITTLQTLIPTVRNELAGTLAFLPALEDFLGTDVPKRYLVIFQNPDELRPTGGFIGSFALLDIDQGEIVKLEVPGGGPYDLACCLVEHVIAPEPLHLIEPHWQFHDANWFPDFPTSAQKLMWFYLKSGGPTVDGVIAINAALVPELLKIVGPIAMPTYGRTFTSANFITETQKIVELEYDPKENRPKAVIGDLAPILIERLTALPPEQLLPLIDILAGALATKDVQLYSADRETQTVFSDVDWTGEVKSTDHDYLLVVSSNIAGGKSNAKIETTIEHHATIHADGSTTDEARIQKIHTGTKGDLFSGVRNVDYVRVYVPEGSSLVAASGFEAPPETLFTNPNADYRPDADLRRLVKPVGFEPVSGVTITEEHGKTVFGNWMQTDPGETTVATLTYRLPRPLAPIARRNGFAAALGVPERLPYTLLVQSQSGAPTQFSHKLIAPQLKKTWGNDAVTQALTGDLFTAALFER